MFLVFAFRVFVAGLLTAILGLEREIHNKDAGLRTYTLVGLGSALVMIVSQYGYDAVIRQGVALDPARTAAQVVSGIGFLGGGLIFVKKDTVRGLTTAAGIWISSAIGLAAGAGLLWLALFVTAATLVTTYGFSWIERRFIRSKGGIVQIDVVCQDARGVLAQVTAAVAAAGHNIESVSFRRSHEQEGLVENRFTLSATEDISRLLSRLADLECVVEAVPVKSI